MQTIKNNIPFSLSTVACASVQSEQMEELLFGQEVEGKISPGLFERAHGGTLFFDEVACGTVKTKSPLSNPPLESLSVNTKSGLS